MTRAERAKRAKQVIDRATPSDAGTALSLVRLWAALQDADYAPPLSAAEHYVQVVGTLVEMGYLRFNPRATKRILTARKQL